MSSTRAQQVALMRSLYQLRAMIEIALPEVGRDLLYGRLKQAGALAESGAFVTRLRQLLPNKRQAIRYVVETFQCRQDGFLIGQFRLSGLRRRFETAPL
jgi:hypothetical protein